MKQSPYMDIRRIEFIVTYLCPGRCKHCSLGDMLNPPLGKPVRIREAKAAVERLSRLFPVSSVMTFGGEPLLYPEVTCSIHETARSCKIASREIITNGYFTKDEQRIEETARALVSAGVNGILLSADAFHQERIPVRFVYSFAKHVKGAGLSNIKLSPAWVVNERHENPYNAKTREILSEFRDLGIAVSEGNDIFMEGNAVKHLKEYYPKPPALDLTEPCGSQPYTEPLTHITVLSIVPNGDVMVCGFVIGNIYEEAIEVITARYNPYENIYMRAILEGGVSSLLKTAEKKGILLDCLECYSACSVCRRVSSQINAGIHESGR